MSNQLNDNQARLFETGADPLLAGSRLSVDLDALVTNYRVLARRSGTARTAGVVKADAYGLGAAEVSAALFEVGCRTFFVAVPEEGIALRRSLPDAEIFAIGGVSCSQAAAACAEARLTPVLNSVDEIAIWSEYWSSRSSRRPCAIHVDTGMNRLGLSINEATAFAEENDSSHSVTPILLMSHLACADEPDHRLNVKQLKSFQRVRAAFKGVESSLCNSAGIFLDPDYHFDVTRPGISLYGGAPVIGHENPMRPVVTAEARIVQIREAKASETVSYGATVTLERDSRLAVVSVGYADGFHRSGSGNGVAMREAKPAGGSGWIAGHHVPIIGRITMDLTIFDVTDIPADSINTGDWIELFGPNIDIDTAAGAAGTISYELLTSLGRRYFRRYLGGGYSKVG